MDLRRLSLMVMGILCACGGGSGSGPDPTTPSATPSGAPAAPLAWAVGTIAGRGAVLRSDDDGRTWSTALLVDGGRTPTDVALADSRTIAVAGTDLLLRSDDGGASWTEQALGLDRAPLLDAVAFAGAASAIAVGGVLGEPDPTSPRPLLFTTRDGGSTWVRPSLPGADSSFELRDVCLTRQGIGLTAGFAFSGDLVLVSRDSGAEWRRVPTDPARFTNPSGVACLRNGDLWVAGARPGEASALGSLLRSTDSGETWEVRSEGLPEDAPALADVVFSDATNGLVVGQDAILSTTNGGASWTREAHPYDGAGANLVAIAAGASRRLAGGTRPSSDGRVGVVLVRIEGEPGWVEGALPAGTEAITGVAFAPVL